MTHTTKHSPFTGRMVIVGFGGIGQGVLPLFLRDLGLKPSQITIITAEERGHEEANEFGVTFINNPLVRENYRAVLTPQLDKGDFLVNLSVNVSSLALVELCQERGAFYLDTCIEPWAGAYTDPTLTPAARSNYALREAALALQKKYPNGPTAVLAHGANPGLVSHFVKQALLNIAHDSGVTVPVPTTQSAWAALAEKMGIKVIHVAERDTQTPATPKAVGEFVNTWSVDGFYGEGMQPAELGWGTHEEQLPEDGRRHDFGCDAAIYLLRPGASTRVRSWTPLQGSYIGWLITHNEAISIADYYTLRDGEEVLYRPTCHYAYHPCDAAVLSLHELAGKNGKLQPKKRLIVEDIVSGLDELGVLLLGHRKGVYWYGSRLSIDETRRIATHNNATSLQVAAAVVAGIVWALENPREGLVEADTMDFKRVLELAAPYLGETLGVWGEWSPLKNRDRLFPEELDRDDPWQFANMRVG